MRKVITIGVLFLSMALSACETGPRTPEQERESEEWFEHEGSA